MQLQNKLLDEEEKNRKEEAKKQLDEQINRLINYLAMREAWQVVKKKAKRHSEDTIYNAFGMSRSQYNNAISGNNIRLSEEHIRRLVKETGVRREIFEGKTCFKFKDIKRSEWEKLLELKKERDENENKSGREKWKPMQRDILARIGKGDMDEINNPDFYQFIVYLRTGQELGNTTAERKIESSIALLSDIKLSDYENCRLKTLQNFVEVINRQMGVAGVVLRYYELRKKTK